MPTNPNSANNRKRPLVIVSGDRGVDVYSLTKPGPLEGINGPDSGRLRGVYPEIAYDVNVPSGAALHKIALESWLDKEEYEVKEILPDRETLVRSLQFIKNHKKRDGKLLRIHNTLPRTHALPPEIEEVDTNGKARIVDFHLDIESNQADLKNAKFLVIYDGGQGWRKSKEAGKLIENFFSDEGDESNKHAIVIVGGKLPGIGSSSFPDILGEGLPWDVLRKHGQRVTILCSATTLRHAQAAVSRRLSMEQSVEDILDECEYFAPLVFFREHFRHLIIRMGFVGALYLPQPKDLEIKRLVLVPNARGGVFRNYPEEGRVIGRKSAIAAAFVRALSSSYDTDIFGDNGRLEDIHDDSRLESHDLRYGTKFGVERRNIEEAIRTGLLVGMRLFNQGLPDPSDDKYHSNSSIPKEMHVYNYAYENFLTDYFKKKPGIAGIAEVIKNGYLGMVGKNPSDANGFVNYKESLGVISVPKKAQPSARDPRQTPWQITQSEIEDRDISRLNVAAAIVFYGQDKVLNCPNPVDKQLLPLLGESEEQLNDLYGSQGSFMGQDIAYRKTPVDHMPFRSTTSRPPICVPIVQFNHLKIIERREIESFRSIRNAMKLYVKNETDGKRNKKPLSFAVFGAPGSGKSFGVKQIAESLNSAGKGRLALEPVEYNLSQFQSPEDLQHALTNVASINNTSRIPLVFFDEFDSRRNDQALGWLKFFLAPMQDGSFYGVKQTVHLGRGIFVFAGGVYKSFLEFNEYANSKKGRDSKGPDFVSRLRGHIDIQPINPDDGNKDDKGIRIMPLLRRAFVLRSQLELSGNTRYSDGLDKACIDPDIVFAMLTVPEYRHGVRSMEAILQMCNPMDGIIVKASLPSREQLGMHVDVDGFYRMMRLSRKRKEMDRDEASVAVVQKAPEEEPRGEGDESSITSLDSDSASLDDSPSSDTDDPSEDAGDGSTFEIEGHTDSETKPSLSNYHEDITDDSDGEEERQDDEKP